MIVWHEIRNMAVFIKLYGIIFQDFFMAEFSKGDGIMDLVWQNYIKNDAFCHEIWQSTTEKYGIKLKIYLIHQ